MKYSISLFFIAVLSLTVKCAPAQTAPVQLKPATRAAVVDSISVVLQKNYIFLDTAARMGNYLKARLKEHAYDSITNPNEFAQKLTTDLLSVYRDLHLGVSYNPQLESMLKDTSAQGSTPEQDLENAKRQNFGFKKLEVLNGNVGYINFDRFTDVTGAAKETIANAFSFLKNVNGLIIDVRNNGGGSPDMVKYICSYFFKASTHINDLYERRTNNTTAYWTDLLNNSGNYPSMPVYILVNSRTFSAAEEFTYDLQSLHRAIIVGETTGGGAHPVSPEIVGNGFIGNIPYARAINPVTHKNWEGTGIIPDIIINADSALDMALLAYFDLQLKTIKDPVAARLVKWSRNMLDAKLHPFNVDTITSKKYIGNFSERIISFENNRLYYAGRDKKKVKLIALSNTTFKLENNDNLMIEFLPDARGNTTELRVTFDDGFTMDYKKKGV